jgi:uncharacterized protein
MRELGVGLVYWSALDPLFEAGTETLAVLELEPQTLWEKVYNTSGFYYRTNEALLTRVARLPQAKLLHGVGHPVGGAVQDPLEHMAPLHNAIEVLNPAWISEHLSFNRVQRVAGIEEAGFLLPPRQSPATVRIASHNIGRYKLALKRAFAFETGVNYLQPHADDLDDGTFFAAVAEQAQCGILLDLHNLWCNELNGRQRVADVLSQIPLDRVWEVHLAGGMKLSGYWLDAHSDAVPPALIDIAAELIPKLPKLGALIYEILPEHLPRIGLDGVQRQLELLHMLWSRKTPLKITPRGAGISGVSSVMQPYASDINELLAWESSLVDAVRGFATGGAYADGFIGDSGVAVLSELVFEFRRANLARAMRYTVTALLAGLGHRETLELLDTYFCDQAPDPYAAIEADHFAQFLYAHSEALRRVPYLLEILAFEHALVRATIYGSTTDIKWSADPTSILEALDAGHLPDDLPTITSRMRVCTD